MKWADYVVTGVQYDDARSRIIGYEVREDLGEVLGHPFKVTWANVAKAILDGTTFITATPGTSGWMPGALLDVVVKTVEDAAVRDNLRHLPAVA
jgi:hypothetical protein